MCWDSPVGCRLVPETRPEGYLAYFAQGGPEAPRRTHTDRWMLPPSTHSLFPEEGVAVLYATVGSRQRCQDPGRGGSVLPHRRPGGAAKVRWAIPPALVSSISQMRRLRLSCPETLGSTGGFTQDGVTPWARRPGPSAPPEGPFPAPERWP